MGEAEPFAAAGRGVPAGAAQGRLRTGKNSGDCWRRPGNPRRGRAEGLALTRDAILLLYL